MIHEECGVFGIWQRENGSVANDVYAGLFALQHRGQEAAGIAVRHTVEETAALIGANSLGYLPVEDVKKLPDQCGLCTACFDGTYPTAIPEQGSKNRFEQPIAE